jgi:hypothetical protein
VAPTDPLPVVRYDAKDHQRSLEVMRWGLVPFWAKDIKVGFANINAKAEGIETKPAFREAFRQRRCLVPVDSFYEWKKIDGGKQPYAIGLKGGGLMALAGLWETWRAPSSGERAQLRHRHHGAKRTVRQDPQPHARGPRARGLAGVARRGAGGRGTPEIALSPLPFRRHDLLAGQPARGQREEQRSEPG